MTNPIYDAVMELTGRWEVVDDAIVELDSGRWVLVTEQGTPWCESHRTFEAALAVLMDYLDNQQRFLVSDCALCRGTGRIGDDIQCLECEV